MKNNKYLISLAVVFILFFSVYLIAQNKQDKTKEKSKTECSKRKTCDKSSKCDYKSKDGKTVKKSCCANKRKHKKNCKSDCKVSVQKAVSIINPTEGNNVHGMVTFYKVENGIKVVADLKGLKPGEHGFHIHQYGDCSDPKGKSAGGHFNPDKVSHAGHESAIRHVGDFGNITADGSGNAHVEFVDSLISFYGYHSIIGRGVVIHAEADDLKSQPSGAAGPRVACGSISLAK